MNNCQFNQPPEPTKATKLGRAIGAVIAATLAVLVSATILGLLARVAVWVWAPIF